MEFLNKIFEWFRNFFSVAKEKIIQPKEPLSPEPIKNDDWVKGIDVSHHNGDVNWDLVKKSGVDFVILKASEGSGFVDGTFIKNAVNAKKAGLKIGAYHFFRARVDGEIQADNFLKQILGVELDIEPVLDWEVDDGLSADMNAYQARRFLNKVEQKTEKKPIIYTGPSFFADKMKSPSGFEAYKLWIAHYTNKTPRVPKPWRDWDIWQFTESGKLSAYPGKQFDVNWMKNS